ncbi:MAG: tyrosine-type recombinase/integrase [Actinomycetes bacterium]
MARLLASCDRRSTFGRRDYAVLTVLARLGLRAGEVAALELTDIDWRAGELVVRGKGRRQERLPLPADVGEALVGWLRRGRPRCEATTVFTTVRAPHRGLTSGVSAIVRAACGRAGLPAIHAHRLRHTAATEMLRAGASLPEVGQVLRHPSVLTTAIYARRPRHQGTSTRPHRAQRHHPGSLSCPRLPRRLPRGPVIMLTSTARSPCPTRGSRTQLGIIRCSA